MKASSAFAGWALAFCSATVPSGDADAQLGPMLIEDFERRDAVDDWSAHQVDFDVFDREADGSGASRAARLVFPQWTPWRGKWPAVILDHGDGQFRTSDWSRYTTFRFEARAHHARVVHLRLRIDDGDGRRAVRIIPVEPNRWTSCEVSVASLADDIDTQDVRRVDFFITQPAADYSLDLDDLRLETGAIAIDEAELSVDPFERGLLVVSTRFNQRASWRLDVADVAGRPVATYTGNGMRMRRREVLSPLVPGRYAVTLSVVAHHEAAVSTLRLGHVDVDDVVDVAPLVAWGAPSTRKVLLHDLPAADNPIFELGRTTAAKPLGRPLRLDMAQGETEAFQVVFRTQSGPTRVGVEPGALVHVDGDAGFAADAVSVSRVLYVDAQQPEEYNVDYSGWWPDPIVPGNQLTVEPGENSPMWISLRSSTDQDPGLYRGDIRVRVGGQQSDWDVIPLEVRVYPVRVPANTTVQTTFSFYEHSLSQVYGERRTEELLPLYRQFIGAHRLNVTNIYTGTPPDPQLLLALRERGQLNRFVALHIETGEYDVEALNELAQTLDPYVAEYRRLGLSEQALIYGFDEVRSHQFADLKAAFAFFKQRYPEIRTATTAADPSLGMDTGLDEVVDVWIPLTAYHDPVSAAAFRARAGGEVWWYICITPTRPHANWFVEYDAVEARLLWWMSHRQRVDGFLYYTLNLWPNHEQPLAPPAQRCKVGDWNPASFGTANGDGCLLYPGPDGPLTSIRLENITDGIEDLELLRMLSRHNPELADMVCDEVAGPGITGFTRDPEQFAQTRRRLLESLSR